ncbi:hypothetical protein LR007_03185, partial [candidate division NPL-UPA2 bacterium]|nr:hypothetical protein [candidate division NPL-UPA2 bacterium]
MAKKTNITPKKMKARKYRFRYQVDPLNRLIISRPFAPDSPLRRKIVVEGEFIIGEGNSLEYYLRAPEPELKEWLRLYGLREAPYKIRFTGKWSLTPEHNLKFTLHKSRTQRLGDRLILKGNILSARGHELLFSMIAGDSHNRRLVRIVKLAGHWQADSSNHLKFLVQRYRQKPDALLFKGAWEVGKHYEIIYSQKKTQLKRRTRIEKKLALKGIWLISSRRQLRFLVEGDDSSVFDFKAMLETPIIHAKKGEVRYRVGISISAKREVIRKITFLGKWRINRDLSLDFEIRYRPGKTHRSHFNPTSALRQFSSGSPTEE